MLPKFQQDKNSKIMQFAENVLKSKNKGLYNEFMELLRENHISRDELMDLLATENTTYNLELNGIYFITVPYMDCQPTPNSDVAYCSVLVETTDGIVEIPCGEISRDAMVLDIQDAEIIDEDRLKILDEAMKRQLTGFYKLLSKYCSK
jgi:hypothetical protein